MPINETKIVLGEGYAWILFEVVIISIHMWITGMMMGSVRKRFFTKEFYETNFPQYKQLTGVMKPDGGYPDDGQGRLANKLNDEQWFIFNNYRRAHMNYLEVISFDLIYNEINVDILGRFFSDHSIINIWSFLYTFSFHNWNYLYYWTGNLFSRLSSIRFKRSSYWSINT
jgi:hypothetical protein